MAGLQKKTTKKPVRFFRRKRKKKTTARGPVMRFKFSRLVLLWILSVILCFGYYLYKINFHPEDVHTSTSRSDESSTVSARPAIPANSGTKTAESSAAADDTTISSVADPVIPPGQQKINPVPQCAAYSKDYLNRCAFVGETNIYNLGRSGLLQPYSVYASERLTLLNYHKEYVMLNGTTIRILSALNSADCTIYLMFGTESLATQPADQTAEQFRVLLNDVMAAAPEAKVIVMSIPPVTSAAEKVKEKPLKNSVIDDYNSKLLEISNKANVSFVDVNTALKDNNGRLDPHYAMEDGIHLTTEAGQLLLDYVLTHVPTN